jgi:hypothetical protein
MVIYICENCKKKFQQRIDYDRHKARKKSCKTRNTKISEDELSDVSSAINKQKFYCPYCAKSFSRMDGVKRHVEKSCTSKFIINKSRDKLLHKLLHRIKNVENENMKLRQMFDKGEIEKLKNKVKYLTKKVKMLEEKLPNGKRKR